MAKVLSENINRVWSSIIINELIQNKITHFYVSPGMRNAPLIAALTFFKKHNPQVEIITCIDERGASYRALGYSKATGTACALLCTSGTALANYLPAVIEAFKTNLPLIVISADRPKEQALSDDNQTINQSNIYGNFIRGELDLGAPSFEISPRALATSLTHLISKANANEKGPVHFNCPLREPLENTKQIITENYLNAAISLIESSLPSTQYLKTNNHLEKNELKNIFKEIANTKSGILVIGSLPPYIDHSPVKDFIKALNWPVYLDVSSSLKYEYSLKENTIPTFDHPEVVAELTTHSPEIIFHIGGRLTAKHYYSLLNSLPHTKLITLNNTSEKEDPSHLTKTRINADINSTLEELTKLFIETNYQGKKLNCNFNNFVENKIKIINDAPLSYPRISKSVIEYLKDDSTIYIANSTIVRSFDSYCSLNAKKRLSVVTNRGVSGIEGFIASACGFADGTNTDIYLIIGDVSLMHDLNSLYFLNNLKHKLKIILINNFGGGIFTLLPISREEDVLSVITSPHNENFKIIAENFRMEYFSVNETSTFEAKLAVLENSKGHALLEIFVDHDANKAIYEKLRTIKLS